MLDYSEADLALLARVVHGVYGWPVEMHAWYRDVWGVPVEGRTLECDENFYDTKFEALSYYADCAWFQIPDFLADPAAALGLLQRLKEDRRISGCGVIWDCDGWGCELYVDGVLAADICGPDCLRAIVLAVDGLLAGEKGELPDGDDAGADRRD